MTTLHKMLTPEFVASFQQVAGTAGTAGYYGPDNSYEWIAVHTLDDNWLKQGLPGGFLNKIPFITVSYYQVNRIVWHPAVPPTPGASLSINANQMSLIMNQGWNTWARSIDSIPPGSFVQCSPGAGSQGIFLGFGVDGKYGENPASFAHGILADSTGVWVFEQGQKVVQLRSVYSPSSVLRIVRQADRSIWYIVATDGESKAYQSSTELPSGAVAYGYGLLYASGDRVTSGAVTTGQIQYGAA